MPTSSISKNSWKVILFFTSAAFTLLPFVASGTALLLGMGIALTIGNPFPNPVKKSTPLLLQISIVGLGASMDLQAVGRAGMHGALYTVVGIVVTGLVGFLLGKILKTPRAISLLITVGTAICGGSAIAAASSAIRAKSEEISVSLATVFFLNAAALFLFPWIGHHFLLSETQFGLWSALAIHDTSSVVGAALQYGPQALELATTVKLARALWIIPVTFFIAYFWKHESEQKSSAPVKRPWFILGFILTAALVTYIPVLQPTGILVSSIAKRTLVFTLFLIGSGLTRATLRAVGLRPFAQGILLWAVVTLSTLGAILQGIIQ